MAPGDPTVKPDDGDEPVASARPAAEARDDETQGADAPAGAASNKVTGGSYAGALVDAAHSPHQQLHSAKSGTPRSNDSGVTITASSA